MFNLITVPSPRLRLVSQPLKEVDQDFFGRLQETLIKKENPPGVGLSAIQTDHPIRLFMTYLPPEPLSPDPPKGDKNLVLTPFINPEIVAHSKETTLGPNPKKPLLEGCLSIPHLYAPVWRWDWIDIEYETPTSSRTTQRFAGFPARVIQHEYDHLNGILFTDHVLGRSPTPGFQPLGPGERLYFDNGEEMVEVLDPTKLIQW